MARFYKHIILTVITLLLLCNYGFTQSVSINQPFKDTLLCKGGQFDISYTVTNSPGSFKPNNIFKVILSDILGNFNSFSPTIGQGYGNQSGTVTCTIPSVIQLGTGYRIRIQADSPGYVSPDNGVNIRISDYPTITSISDNTPICVGNTLNLAVTTSTPNTTFAWEGPGGYTSNIQNAVLNNATLSHNNVFTAKVTAWGCTATDTITPYIAPPPAKPIASTNSPVCEREDLGLASYSTSQGVTYLWEDDQGNALSGWDNFIVKNATPANSGLYIVTVQIGSCTAKDTVYAVVKPAPDTAAVSHNPPLCAGDTLLLTGSTSQANISSYNWTGPGGFMSSDKNPAVPNVPKSYEGEFRLVLKMNGCESLPSRMQVKIAAPIAVPEIIGDSTLCPGDTLQLTTKGGVGVYQWNGPNDFHLLGGAIFKTGIEAKHAGTYTLKISHNGCESKPVSINIEVPDIKKPNPTNNSPICEGEELQLGITETPGGTYSWTGPDNFTSTDAQPAISGIQFKHEGTYRITTNYKYCTEKGSTIVSVKPIPEITDISNNGPLCYGKQIQLNSEANINGSTYSWTGPDGFKSDMPNPTLVINEKRVGNYSLTVEHDGCVSTPVSTKVEMKEGPWEPSPSNNSLINEGQQLMLYAGDAKDGTTFLWEGPDNFTSTEKDPTILDASILHAGTYKVIATYNGCTATGSTLVNIRSHSKVSVKLYPNPNTGTFTISGIIPDNSEYKFVIIDLMEHIIHKGTISPTNKKFEQTIQLDDVPNGMYILQVGNKSYKFDVLKQ